MAAGTAPLDLTLVLGPERVTLLKLLCGLSELDWERPTECPAWTVKGIALHILGDDLSLLTRQRDAATNSLVVFAEEHPGLSFRALLDGFNEHWVSASRFLSNELVIELLGLVGDWSETFYRDVGLETASGEAVGFFAETEPSPYWQVIAREYVERFVHQSQIRRAIGSVELDGEVATEAARVILHAIAAWMLNYAPATDSAIAIDFGPIGAWTLARTGDRWTVRDGTEQSATARIAVSPTAAVAMLSRGVAQHDVAAQLTISGDESLAHGALEIMAPLLGTPS